MVFIAGSLRNARSEGQREGREHNKKYVITPAFATDPFRMQAPWCLRGEKKNVRQPMGGT